MERLWNGGYRLMPTFTPPVGSSVAWGDINSNDPADRLMKYYGSVPVGETVMKTQAGAWVQQQYPYLGRTDSPGVNQAQQAYIGGHTYEVTDAVATELIAAGFGAYLNTEPVDYTWFKPSYTSKFSEWFLTIHSSSVYALKVEGDENLQIYLTSGTAPIQDNSRRFFIHSDTHYNTDFDATVTLDPVLYGVFGVAEQSGIVLRAQQSGGFNRGITINNNIFGVIPNVNIGVWSSAIDGLSGFQNRQTSISVFGLLSFPMKYDVKLRSNIITVRVYKPGLAAPRWDDPVYAKTVNLDTDAGTAQQIIDNPTPVGDGGAGLIAAHLGTTPPIAAKYRGWKVGPAQSLFPDGLMQ